MADQTVKDEHVETQIQPLSVSTWQGSVASAVNQTYSYSNSALFCAVISGYNKDYAYRYVLTACQWLDGYVPRVHWDGSGIMSTHVAGSLINGLARTIVGEKLVFRIKGKKDADAMANLNFISTWADTNNIKRAVKNAIAFAEGIGTSLLKANVRATLVENKKVWWEAVRFDNAFFLADSSGEVYDVEFLLRPYVDTRNKDQAKGNVTQFYLTEHRFYEYSKGKIRQNADGTSTVIEKKGDKIPTVEYRVHRAEGQSLNNTMASGIGRSSVGWTEIPQEIQKLIKRDYSLIRINEPTRLPFANTLGVELLVNDDGDISIPTGAQFGRSLIVPIVDDLVMYEIAQAYALRDMYLGKGTVYVPKAMTLGDNSYPLPQRRVEVQQGNGNDFTSDAANHSAPTTELPQTNIITNPLDGMSDKYETIPGNNPEDQQVTVAQFELRPDQWELIQENALKRIAIKWGMSPKIMASFLAQGQVQQTATQIDSEDDISIAFIEQARAIFNNPINRLLETTLNFYGKPTNVDVKFASPSIVNKDRILDRTLKKLDAGLIDIEEAIRETNPDLDEETLQARIDAAKAQQQMQMLQQMAEMNDDGGFGNSYDDLGGPNLKGSTSPRQN